MENIENESVLVTVITTTFNLVKSDRVGHFRNCVASVQAQTYKNVEHLVIDGASTDGTLEIIREYENEGKLKCYSEPDKGIYDAMNKGIALAKGKYIAFLNSDDLWHDARGIEMSVSLLEYSQADFSYAPVRFITEEGDFIRSQNPQIGGFYCYMPFCHQTMFTRVDAIRRVGGFDGERYSLSAAYDTTMKLIMNAGKVVYVPLNFTTFRRSGASIVNNQQAVKDWLEIRRKFFVPMFGENVMEQLATRIVPQELLTTLMTVVHPTVAVQMQVAAVPRGNTGMYAIKAQQITETAEDVKNSNNQAVPKRPDATVPASSKKEKVKDPLSRQEQAVQCGVVKKISGLFNLPLLQVEQRSKSVVVYKVLKWLTILKKVEKQSARGGLVARYKLFGVLPMWSVKYNDNGIWTHQNARCYFLGVPVYTVRERV